MSQTIVGSWTFRCPRCRREWQDSVKARSVRCICEHDCDYCGGVQTATLPVTHTKMNYSFEYDPTELEPSPRESLWECTVCGYRQPKQAVDAQPIDESEFNPEES